MFGVEKVRIVSGRLVDWSILTISRGGLWSIERPHAPIPVVGWAFLFSQGGRPDQRLARIKRRWLGGEAQDQRSLMKWCAAQSPGSINVPEMPAPDNAQKRQVQHLKLPHETSRTAFKHGSLLSGKISPNQITSQRKSTASHQGVAGCRPRHPSAKPRRHPHHCDWRHSTWTTVLFRKPGEAKLAERRIGECVSRFSRFIPGNPSLILWYVHDIAKTLPLRVTDRRRQRRELKLDLLQCVPAAGVAHERFDKRRASRLEHELPLIARRSTGSRRARWAVDPGQGIAGE